MRGVPGIFLLLVLISCAAGCSKGDEPAPGGRKLQVVTTLFPLYDFTRFVGGERVEVRLLLPPGVEPHNFEPKPEDVARLSRTDLFVYTNKYMEPWAEALVQGVSNPRLLVVDSSVGASLIPVTGHDGHEEKSGSPHTDTPDPHIWLDIGNAQKMVENVRDALIRKDPAGADSYRRNAEAYLAQLSELDRKFREGLANCSQRIFFHGGHYAFGYLAARYDLRYLSAYAVSANAEPTPRRLMMLVDQMKRYSVKTIFYEELLSPRMAETVARETGATLLKLHGIHNVSREDMAAGVTYLSLMELNLKNLRIGLQCR